MTPPNAKMISKKPFTIKCPACSETFCIDSYAGNTGEDRIIQMESAYEKHFNKVHAHEDASQAAARIVREATKMGRNRDRRNVPEFFGGWKLVNVPWSGPQN